MSDFLAKTIKDQTDSILRRMKNVPAATVRGGTTTPGTGPGTNPEVVEPNRDLDRHKSSGDHDGRYYTETEVDALIADIPEGGASTFIDLTDVPDSYSGQQGKFTRVNSTEDGIEFAAVAPGSGAASFVDLSDVPSSFEGQGGKVVAVNKNETALEFAQPSRIITDWSYRSTSRSLSAFAWKGNIFIPHHTIRLYAIAYYGGVVGGGIYQAAVCEADAEIITKITKTPSITMPNTLDGGWMWMWFDYPVELTPGTAYNLITGRIDGEDNYALPLSYNGGTTAENAVPMPGLSHGRSCRIAQREPEVGDTVELLSTNSVGAGYAFEIL